MSIPNFGIEESRIINSAEKIVIYGFGDIGKCVYKDLSVLNKQIDVLDRKSDLVISEMSDVKWYLPEKYDWMSAKNAIIIIASSNYSDEITKDLLEKGIEQRKIVYPYNVIIRKNDLYKNIITKRKPRKDLRFVVCITEHCNLNCAMCDHFSPLSKEWYMRVEDFERDMRRMSVLFKEGEVSVIDIEGGEPLLHKEIVSFMRISRECFPSIKTKIKVYTNGLLLDKAADVFWKECINSKIIIRVTKYPIKCDYAKMKKNVIDHGVEFEFANDEYVDKEMIRQCLDIDGNQDKYESFHNCFMANGDCAELRLGKFYQCNIIANLHIFNEYFKKNLRVEDRDYIDIYSDVTKDDFFDYLCAPASACRYCKTKEWVGGNLWKVSQKTIDEWI